MKRKNMLSNALILSVGGVLAKLFSAVYRIVLTRILGGEGIGIYQLIFPFYSLCVTLATAGLPLAISKVVSKHAGNEKTVLKKCFMFTSVIGLVLTLVLLVFSKGLAWIQGVPELSVCYICLAPSIIIISISSVLRGYFQGKHNFIPSAISNILEQFIKMCVGLILSLSLVSVGLIYGVIGAVVGILISEIISLWILLIFIKKEKLKRKRSSNVCVKDIIKDVVPITITNIILPISSFIDSLLVINLLKVNFSNGMSVFLYGLESGAVSTLVGLPTIFSFAIASVILPNLSSDSNVSNSTNKFTFAIKIVLLIAIPSALCFVFIPHRLISLIYGTGLNSLGVDGLIVSARLLAFSGIGVIFLAVNQILSSGLQAMERRSATIRNLAIAVVAKFVIELVFLPAKFLNIYALAISNTCCYALVMILNYFELKQILNFKLDYLFILKSLLANCFMLFGLILVLSISNAASISILGLIFAVIIYFISLFKWKIFSKHDIALLKYRI